MKLSVAIDKVIGLASAIHDYWELELPKRHPGYPLMNPGEQALPIPPEEKKLAKLLAGLPADRVYQIGLIMDLGRDYFVVSELAEHYKKLMEEFSSSTDLASVLTSKATLAAYLQDGLAELKKHDINVDRLPLKAVKSLK